MTTLQPYNKPTSLPTTGIIFKEVFDKNELEEILHLRYEEYLHSRMQYWVRNNKNGVLDIDDWDPYSRHFGLYNMSSGGVPVGYMRVTQNEKTAQTNYIHHLCKKSNTTIRNPKEILPVFTYFPGAKEWYTENNKIAFMNICEPGRFTIKKEYRNGQLARFLIESAISTFAVDYSHAIHSCAVSHYAYYLRLGFKRVPGTRDERIDFEFGLPSLLLLLGRENFMSESKRHFLDNQALFNERGWLRMGD